MRAPADRDTGTAVVPATGAEGEIGLHAEVQDVDRSCRETHDAAPAGSRVGASPAPLPALVVGRVVP